MFVAIKPIDKLTVLGSIAIEWSDNPLSDHWHRWEGSPRTPDNERKCKCGAYPTSEGSSPAHGTNRR